ncbi:hypothetical protein ACH4SP_11980 [Streptomyces sp. NPDC021093]
MPGARWRSDAEPAPEHGGTLTLGSEPGATAFVLELPRTEA